MPAGKATSRWTSLSLSRHLLGYNATCLFSRRAPTLADKKAFSHNIYHITADELGKVIQILDQRCDTCIRKVRWELSSLYWFLAADCGSSC